MENDRYDSSRGPAPRHRSVHALDRHGQSIRNRAAFPTVGRHVSLVSTADFRSRSERPDRSLVCAADGHRRAKAGRGRAPRQRTQSSADHRHHSGARLVGAHRRQRRVLQSALPGLHRPFRGTGEWLGLDRCRPPGGCERSGVDLATHHGFQRRGRGRSAATTAGRRLSLVSVPGESAARRARNDREVVRDQHRHRGPKAGGGRTEAGLRQFRRCPGTQPHRKLHHGPGG